MANGYGSVGSVLSERPPSDSQWAKPNVPGPVTGYRQHDAAVESSSGVVPLLSAAPPAAPPPAPAPPAVVPLVPKSPPAAHPTQPPPSPQPVPPGHRSGQPAGPSAGNRTWYDSLLSGRQYDVVYDDADGYPLLAFAEGQWYDVTQYNPQPVSVRYALRLDPAWAGALVQTVCMWMRGNPNHDRSFELATELALAVGELARMSG